MTKFDLLIKDGYLVDTANNREGRYDLGLCDGKVVDVDPDLNLDQAADVFDAKGKLVFPGLVDTHVHLTHTEQAVGFQMLARAGVTCALECGGFLEDVIKGMAACGSGISIAVLNRLDPGVSISGPDAAKSELIEYLEQSLEQGALGFKLLGGHLPLSPETTSTAIEVVNQNGAYVAFHCGTTQNGSNLKGMLEALELAGSHRLHVCHVTAYCRGLTHGSPVTEIMMALEALATHPHLVSESYPRNFLLSHGLSLVRFDALTLSELVHKCCRAPARMLGLPNKGHLAPGADADLVVADPNTHEAVLTVAGGNVIMSDGLVIGSGGTIITTERGTKALQAKGVQAEVANLAESLFYNAPEN